MYKMLFWFFGAGCLPGREGLRRTFECVSPPSTWDFLQILKMWQLFELLLVMFYDELICKYFLITGQMQLQLQAWCLPSICFIIRICNNIFHILSLFYIFLLLFISMFSFVANILHIFLNTSVCPSRAFPEFPCH